MNENIQLRNELFMFFKDNETKSFKPMEIVYKFIKYGMKPTQKQLRCLVTANLVIKDWNGQNCVYYFNREEN